MEKKDKECNDCSKAAHFDCTPNDTVLFPQTLHIYQRICLHHCLENERSKFIHYIIYEICVYIFLSYNKNHNSSRNVSNELRDKRGTKHIKRKKKKTVLSFLF